MNGALLVIDMQNDYLWDKRKSIFNYDTHELVSAVNASIAEYSRRGYDVVYIAQIFPDIITNRWFIGFSIKGTEGAELYSGLNIVSELYFEKNLPNSFSASGFRKHMEGKKHDRIVLCGLDECGCVGATARGALKTGSEVCIISNSTGRRFPDAKTMKNRLKLEQLGVKFI